MTKGLACKQGIHKIRSKKVVAGERKGAVSRDRGLTIRRKSSVEGVDTHHQAKRSMEARGQCRANQHTV